MIQDISSDFVVGFQLTDSNGAPVAPDSAPTVRIYDPAEGQIADLGTSELVTGTITNVSNAVSAVITDANHTLTGTVRVTISGVVGPTAVNTTTTATVLTSNTFSVPIDTSAASAYSSGGTWVATGAYKIEFGSSVRNLLEAGKTYLVIVDYQVSSAQRQRSFDLEAA